MSPPAIAQETKQEPTQLPKHPCPFLKWAGGKRELLPEIFKVLDSFGKFATYHEPFLGGGALFFALYRAGRVNQGAVLSDINHNLIETYQALRDDVEAVVLRLHEHKKLHDKAYYYEVRGSEPESLIERAARIIYLNRTCFNGLYRENSKGKFNVPIGRYTDPRICDEVNLRAVSNTLGQVTLSGNTFEDTLDRAQRNDLVYFDPPYIPLSKTSAFTSYSRAGFELDAQERLADVARELSANGVKVILSNSMTELTRELYTGFYILEVRTRRRVNAQAGGRNLIGEALISNGPLLGRPRSTSVRLQIVDSHQHGKKGNKAKRLNASDPDEQLPWEPQINTWLRDNGYEDVVEQIMTVNQTIQAAGGKLSRNWWAVLAGKPDGLST